MCVSVCACADADASNADGDGVAGAGAVLCKARMARLGIVQGNMHQDV